MTIAEGNTTIPYEEIITDNQAHFTIMFTILIVIITTMLSENP